MIRRLVLMVIVISRRLHPARDGASRARPKSTPEFPHPPLLLLLLNEQFHRIIILDIGMHLLVNKLLISLPLPLG